MKHAYLIITHKKTPVLEKCIQLLDSTNSDIYIHVDAKQKKFDFDKISKLVFYSKVIFTERIKVYWGDYSQVQSELILLKTAIKGKYDYYHLLSGQDMPLKSNQEIDRFFQKHKGKEYVTIDNAGKPCEAIDEGGVFSLYNRLALYHLGIKGWRKNKLYKGLEYISILLQNKIGIDRIRNLGCNIYYGSNWFSITNLCAKYVVSQEKQIEGLFGKYTRCSDELFLQTVLMNSPFRNKVVGRNFRHIDFKRGRPYVWHVDDINELKCTDDLFARKFDFDIDENIINMIFDLICVNSQ